MRKIFLHKNQIFFSLLLCGFDFRRQANLFSMATYGKFNFDINGRFFAQRVSRALRGEIFNFQLLRKPLENL